MGLAAGKQFPTAALLNNLKKRFRNDPCRCGGAVACEDERSVGGVDANDERSIPGVTSGVQDDGLLYRCAPGGGGIRSIK